MKKVVILGAGIAGLTVAHELIRSGRDDDIHIYDKKSVIGGMARSGVKKKNNTPLPTEYSWRIYGPNYHNLRDIFKQIPLINDPNKTVHDNLIDIHDYLIADKQTIFHMNNRPKTLWEMRRAFRGIPFKQKWRVIRKIIYCVMISTERLNHMDNLTWNDYIDPDRSLCHDMRKYIIDIMGPFLGVEVLRVNVPSTIKTLESFKLLNRPISVMNGPTNEAWFEHWQAYLKHCGVIFHLDHEVTDIHTEGDRVTHVMIANSEISGDIFFCCLPVDSVAKIPSLSSPEIVELAQNGYQLMVGMQLYFDKKIVMPSNHTAMYIPDSPWQLVIEPQGAIWNKTYVDAADVWSVGLCDPSRPGLFIKKPFIHCSHEEIQQEVWYQITHSELGDYLLLNTVQVIDYNVWDTYRFNGHALETDEPKFSTNKGTWFLRPNNKTRFNNLYFAAAYTKTETDMFEMESAAESGRRAAKLIEKSVHIIPSHRPQLFAFYRNLDAILKPLNLYRYVTLGWFFLGLPFAALYGFGAIAVQKIRLNFLNVKLKA
ncbi:MAG: NAD(P)-binding protein [Legionella sp.]|nr:NAD(P)-binding protein [Legionella sp.]